MNKKEQISLAAEPASLAIFRDFIEEMCQDHPGIDHQDLYDLKLAVDEACTNIITHGYAGLDPGSITLSCEVEKDRVVMSFVDFGHPFEPGKASRPNPEARLDDRSIGGFGLFFIYETMDEVAYETSEDGNRLTLYKYIAPVLSG